MNYHAVCDRLADASHTRHGIVEAFRDAYLIDDAMTREEYYSLVERMFMNETGDEHINRMRGRLAAIRALRSTLGTYRAHVARMQYERCYR